MIPVYLKVFHYVRPYVGRLILIVVLSLLSLGISFLVPLTNKFLVDKVLIGGNLADMKWIFLLIITVFLSGLAVGIASRYTLVTLSETLDIKIVSSLFWQVLSLPAAFFDNHRTGELIYRLFVDTRAISAVASGFLVSFIVEVMTLVGVLLMLAFFSYKLALLAILIIPVHVLIILCFRNPIQKMSSRVRSLAEQIQAGVVEGMQRILQMKVSRVESNETARLQGELGNRKRLAIQADMLNGAASVLSGSVNLLGALLVIWFAAIEVVNRHMSIGDLVAASMIIGRVYSPVLTLTSICLSLQDNLVAIRRVYELFDALPEDPGGKLTLPCRGPAGHLQMAHVFFAYDGRTPILRDVSLELMAGEKMALLGESGAGKSTIAKLLVGLYVPITGTISIDNMDIQTINRQSLRQHVGVVLQNSFVFSGTIIDNITYGIDHVEEKRLMEISEAVCLNAFVRSLPKGYHSVVGEHGVKLSGGERQKIALARALLQDYSILVLDEALSSVDIETENIIWNNLWPLIGHRSAIIISHRLSVTQRVDKVIVLDEGRVTDTRVASQYCERSGENQARYNPLLISAKVMQ